MNNSDVVFADHREQPLPPVHYGCVISLWTVGPSRARTRTALCDDAAYWHPWTAKLGVGGGPDSGVRMVNAPAVWRKSVRRHLLELNYKESIFDPCLYYLELQSEERAPGQVLGVAGVVLLDVDDFCQGGNERHQELMGALRTRLKFGKWKDVYMGSADYIGRTLKQMADYEIKVSMRRYITEKLNPATLHKDRVKEKDSLLSDKEISQLRGVGGALLWVGKEGRPDVGAACAMAMSWSPPGPTVDHILMANKTVKEIKATPDVELRVLPLEPLESHLDECGRCLNGQRGEQVAGWLHHRTGGQGRSDRSCW